MLTNSHLQADTLLMCYHPYIFQILVIESTLKVLAVSLSKNKCQNIVIFLSIVKSYLTYLNLCVFFCQKAPNNFVENHTLGFRTKKNLLTFWMNRLSPFSEKYQLYAMFFQKYTRKILQLHWNIFLI